MGLGWQELLIVLAIVLLLFGSAKLPQLMRGLGQGIGEFKQGMKEPPDDFSDGIDDESDNNSEA